MKAKTKAAKAPSAEELAAIYGFDLRDPLPKGHTRRLRRGLPGGDSVLRDAGQTMSEVGDALRVRNTTPEKIAEVAARHARLRAAEAVLETVHRSVYEQRLQADDEIVELLRRVDRSVKNTEDPDVIWQFGFLRDFLAQLSGGRPKKGAKKKVKKKRATPPRPPKVR